MQKWFNKNKTFEDNKKKYRKLCFKYHPDRQGGINEIMSEINVNWDKYEKELLAPEIKIHFVAKRKKHYRPTPDPETKFRTDFNFRKSKFRTQNQYSYQKPTPPKPKIKIYTYRFKNKKYTGTKEEILYNVFLDFGTIASLKLLVDFSFDELFEHE